MAKVDGPLMSLEARGKIADAIVFFPWKGRHAVRQWLKPTNPMKTLQGYVRAALRAIGKEVKVIACVSKGSAVDSKLYNGIVAKVGPGMNWNAFHAQGLLKLFIVAGAFATTAFAANVAKYSTHGAKTAWDSQGTALGLVDNAFPYGYTTSISAGCQLFFGALAAFANLASWGANYTVDPGVATYAASNVDAFATAHTA
jgi:hypothetical protein